MFTKQIADMLTLFLDVVKEIERRGASRSNRRVSDQECFADIQELETEFERFKAGRLQLVKEQEAAADQDLISRGMYNSTIRDAKHRQIGKDAIEDVDRAHKSLRNAIEKLEFHRAKRD